MKKPILRVGQILSYFGNKKNTDKLINFRNDINVKSLPLNKSLLEAITLSVLSFTFFF